MSVLKRKNELGQWEPIQQVTSNALTLGGKPPEYYLQPRNLLDNSDFRNPVNQRGQTSYTGSGYTIDRWRAYHADTTHTIVDGGISVSSTGANPNIYQPLDASKFKEGVAYTAAVCDIEGNIYIWTGTKDNTVAYAPICVYISGNNFLFRLSSNNKTWAWAALYEGEYTAETLPPYVPKGYALELAECKRYYKHYTWLNCTRTTGDYFSVAQIIEMRAIPTVTFVQFSPFGNANITDMTDCYLGIGWRSGDNVSITYAKLPTCSAHSAGGLCVILSADL